MKTQLLRYSKNIIAIKILVYNGESKINSRRQKRLIKYFLNINPFGENNTKDKTNDDLKLSGRQKCHYKQILTSAFLRLSLILGHFIYGNNHIKVKD